MRRFSSYGPINTKLHYYAPRKELLNKAYTQLRGENPEEGGHYITVWAPRQTGKSWTLKETVFRLREDKRFDVIVLSVEYLKTEKNVSTILRSVGNRILEKLDKKTFETSTPEKFQKIFRKDFLSKPLILILDEFDALEEDAISTFAGIFRDCYNDRLYQADRSTEEKDYLLHSVALTGVRTVLGIENKQGSPFNVQRSLHIQNLTYNEVEEMFKWYERESGQKFEKQALDLLYYETNGQPGLIGWFGELLTEGWEDVIPEKDKPITMDNFKEAAAAARSILPNSNILNIISKAKQDPYKQMVLDMFRTDEKIQFEHNKTVHNFLYMNGVIEIEKVSKTEYYAKFPCPFVQRCLFSYFSGEIFDEMGRLHDPFADLDDAVTRTHINIKNIMKLYSRYLMDNRKWLLKDVPRRSDLRIFEAVFHFNLYKYLDNFFHNKEGQVIPEFPTGNGKINIIIIKYAGKIYGLELKTYRDNPGYKKALKKAAQYGQQLKLEEISLIFFIESIKDEIREKYEAVYFDQKTKVKVVPIFVETGN